MALLTYNQTETEMQKREDMFSLISSFNSLKPSKVI